MLPNPWKKKERERERGREYQLCTKLNKQKGYIQGKKEDQTEKEGSWKAREECSPTPDMGKQKKDTIARKQQCPFQPEYTIEIVQCQQSSFQQINNI